MSLNSHSIGYQITGKDVGFSIVTGLSALPYAKRHFELIGKTSGFVSFLHYTVGILECLPGGFLIGLIDRIVGWAVSFFQSKEKQQMPRIEHFPDQTLQLISSYLPLKDQAHFALVFKKAHQVTQPLITAIKEGEENIKKAIDFILWNDSLRITESGLRIHTLDCLSLTEEAFEKLKQYISLIPNNMINDTSGYRDGLDGREYKTVTLLSEAIERVKPDEMCLKVVQILLDKGASALIETGVAYLEKSPIDLARERRFPELVALIQSKMPPC